MGLSQAIEPLTWPFAIKKKKVLVIQYILGEQQSPKLLENKNKAQNSQVQQIGENETTGC